MAINIQGRQRNYIRELWIGAPPARNAARLTIEGLTCYYVPSVFAKTNRNETNLIQLSWDEFIHQFRYGSVIDCHQGGTLDRLHTLYPTLEAGGKYELTYQPLANSNNAESAFNEIADRSNRWFAGYLRRFSRYPILTDRGIRFEKTKFNQWTGRAVSINEVSPHAAQTVPDAHYDRIAGTIYGSKHQQQKLERLTRGYARQHVHGQRWLELSDVIVEGYGQVHPTDETVLAESFSHLKQSKRGLLHASKSTDWFASEIPIAPNRTISIDRPAVLLKQPWDGNYGHWLIDNFSRLAGSGSLKLHEVNFILSSVRSEAMTKVMQDALALLEVPMTSLIFLDMHPVRVEHALYPEPLTSAPLVKHPATMSFLEMLVIRARELGGVNRAPSGRIYISRNAGSRRRLINELELIPRLQRANYHVIELDSLPLYDQIVSFGAATHVIGNMGAGFANLAFSPRGVKVATIANTVMAHDYFYDITCLKAGEYIGIQGTGASKIGDDFTVDIDLATSSLDNHGFV